MIEKKRMRALQEAVPKYKNLFEAVHICIRAFKSGDKPSPYQTDNVNFTGITQ